MLEIKIVTFDKIGFDTNSNDPYKTCTKLQINFEFILNLQIENGLSEKKFPISVITTQNFEKKTKCHRNASRG